MFGKKFSKQLDPNQNKDTITTAKVDAAGLTPIDSQLEFQQKSGGEVGAVVEVSTPVSKGLSQTQIDKQMDEQSL